jgi:hypothetical protein
MTRQFFKEAPYTAFDCRSQAASHFSKPPFTASLAAIGHLPALQQPHGKARSIIKAASEGTPRLLPCRPPTSHTPPPPLSLTSHHAPHGAHRRRRGVPPPRALRRRPRVGGLLPGAGARGGLRRGGHQPGRLPRLRLPRERNVPPDQDVLRGGQDRRGQPRPRRLPLRRHGLQEPPHPHRHEARARAPRRVRRVQRRFQQVPQ